VESRTGNSETSLLARQGLKLLDSPGLSSDLPLLILKLSGLLINDIVLVLNDLVLVFEPLVHIFKLLPLVSIDFLQLVKRLPQLLH